MDALIRWEYFLNLFLHEQRGACHLDPLLEQQKLALFSATSPLNIHKVRAIWTCAKSSDNSDVSCTKTAYFIMY